MSENKKWFAVYTRPRCEKKVAEILSRKKIENYCPINKIVRHWSDRKKIIQEPLFPYFVFVKSLETDLLCLKETDGVINFVYWLGRPVIIRDSEIDAIKQFTDEYNNIRLEKIDVRVDNKEPLKEYNANVIALKNKSVKVELPSLGYLMVAEMETEGADIMEGSISPRMKLSYFKYAFK